MICVNCKIHQNDTSNHDYGRPCHLVCPKAPSPKMSDVLTDELKEAVKLYLVVRVIAESFRAKVDAIQKEILTEIPLYVSERFSRSKQAAGERITEGKNLYLCEDAEGLARYYDECNRREKAAGIKPQDMDKDFCPALVAEHVRTNRERDVLLLVCKHFDLEADSLHLEHRAKMLDLTVRFVKSTPGFDFKFTPKQFEEFTNKLFADHAKRRREKVEPQAKA